jgi:Fe-S cluster assembly ATP-binding protein
MLKLTNLTISLSENNQTILSDINLEFHPGKIYYIEGANGSGKSSLASSVMGNPNYEIESGKITVSLNPSKFISEKLEVQVESRELRAESKKTQSICIVLNELDSNERNLLGIFLAEQHPVEIPGVSLMQFLRLIYNIRRPKEEQMPVFKFRKLVQEKAQIINYPEKLLERNLNEGFSGGEKKKTEILQMLILEPYYVFLDEIDSGLDKQSRVDVFTGLRNFFNQRADNHNPVTYIIISHYDSAKEFLPADEIVRLEAGSII